MREWYAHMRQPKTLAALSGVGVVTGLAGPFGTSEQIELLPRLIYWGLLSGGSYAIGSGVYFVFFRQFLNRSRWQRIALSGLVTGLIVFALVFGLNQALFANWYVPGALAPLLASIVAISVVITALIDAFSRSDDLQSASQAPAILDRVPLEKRGDLVGLSVADHYVYVRITQGDHMVLIRLSDSIRETGSIAGAQVHRSHWVAFDQVVAVEKQGGRTFLRMTRGPDIPVSRTNLPKLKEAGLLPR